MNVSMKGTQKISTAIADRSTPTAWRLFYVFGVLACFVYVLCMYYTPLAVIPIAGHDDGHYLKQALDITSGNWLGAYDHMTLIKGPGLPLFIALSKVLGLPYSISIGLLEAGSFFMVSVVIGRLARAPALAFLMLAVLLTFPWMWSGASLRILRDQYYTCLILIFLATSFVIIWGDVVRKRYLALAAGFALGLVSVTREENPWLWPAVIVLVIALYFMLPRKNGHFVTFAMVVLLGAAGVWSVRGAIMTINYVKYGLFEVTDIRESNFRSAMRVLYSIDTPERSPYVVVSKEARAAAYEHSPTFATLRSWLEGPLMGWQGPGCESYGGKLCGDYGGGWFVWAFRDAVTLTGGYTDAHKASEFYRKVAEEITRACDNRQIACRYSLIADIPPLVPTNYVLIFKAVGETIKLISLAAPTSAARPRSEGSLPHVDASFRLLNRPIAAPHITDPQEAIYSGKAPRSAVVFVERMQNAIRTLFETVWPVICAIGVLGILFSTLVHTTTRDIDGTVAIAWIFLLLTAVRSALLSVVDGSVHSAVNTAYANPAAYCLVIAVVMGIHMATRDLSSLRQRRRR